MSGSDPLSPAPTTLSPHEWNGDLYFCTQDARFIVPKRNPWLGWTLNLGHPYSQVALPALVILPPLLLLTLGKRR